jgi:hypothetical protein
MQKKTNNQTGYQSERRSQRERRLLVWLATGNEQNDKVKYIVRN